MDPASPQDRSRYCSRNVVFWGPTRGVGSGYKLPGPGRAQGTPTQLNRACFFIIFEYPAKVIRSGVRQCLRCLCICDPEWWANSRIRPLGPEKVAAPGPEFSLGGPECSNLFVENRTTRKLPVKNDGIILLKNTLLKIVTKQLIKLKKRLSFLNYEIWDALTSKHLYCCVV
jgi:hypothetical protein